ncbi:mechanosensitive ion channel family protein [Spirosoma arcticum]
MNNLPNLQEILTNIVTGLINQLVNFIPRLITALVILIVGLLIAKLIRTIIKTVLSKIGVDKVGEKLNEIDFVKKLNTDIKISSILAQVIYFFIALVFATAAAEMLGVAALTDLMLGITNLIPKLIVAGVMLIVGLFISEGLKQFVISICNSFNISAGRMLGTLVFFFFLIISLINALRQAGLNTGLLESSFNLIIGGVIFAFAVGYGIASRDVMANMLSSFYSKNKYQEGQTIQIDDTKGQILKIDSTSLTLQTGETTTVFPLQVLQTKKVEVF